MVRSLSTTLALFALLAGAAAANTIVVDPGGGGNFDNIPEAMFRGTAADTVLVMPGYYEVEQGIPYPWPIPLTSDSPTLVSRGGAAVTLIIGDGSLSAFEVVGSRFGPRVFISGFKFMSLESPFDWDSPSFVTEVCFTDNIVEGCETGVDVRWGDGLIARNTIEGPGYYGIQAPYFEGTIEDNEISGFTEAGIMSTNENTLILRNHIHDNEFSGITSSADCIAEDNLIENNGWDGLLIAFDAHLTNNVIRNNGAGIEFWGGPHHGFMHENEIYDNVDVAVTAYAGDLDPPTFFDATLNWWGTTDPVAISESIWDCHDSEWAGVCFVFEPWCVTPACDPTGVDEEATWGAIKALYR